jgi:cytidine deaminase
MKAMDGEHGENDQTEARLLRAAQAAMAMSYSPYSHYPVGAALLLADGRIVSGANIENAAYPVSLCAERAAVAVALAAGQREFAAIAVASRGTPPAPPCGACRQVLSEFNPVLPVLVTGESGPAVARYTLDELLPWSFGPQHLEREHAASGPA